MVKQSVQTEHSGLGFGKYGDFLGREEGLAIKVESGFMAFGTLRFVFVC